MDIISPQSIRNAVDIDAVIKVVKQSFIDKEKGYSICPTPMQMLFHNEHNQFIADCHVKAAQNQKSDYFVIKVASGFYENKYKNLPVNNGLSLLLSATTGAPVALLQDEGMLTSMRTAAAGAISAGLAINNDSTSNKTLGIIGTGHQAKLQAQWVCYHTGITNVVVLGRSAESTSLFAKHLSTTPIECTVAHNAKELARLADIIITTTPATSPLLTLEDITTPTHIVAVGADSPGKQELDPHLLQQAEIIITDDHQQCLAHGELGIAYRSQLIAEDKDIALGRVLSGEVSHKISGKGLSIVDLTGLGSQDLAIASYVWEKIREE